MVRGLGLSLWGQGCHRLRWGGAQSSGGTWFSERHLLRHPGVDTASKKSRTQMERDFFFFFFLNPPPHSKCQAPLGLPSARLEGNPGTLD